MNSLRLLRSHQPRGMSGSVILEKEYWSCGRDVYFNSPGEDKRCWALSSGEQLILRALRVKEKAPVPISTSCTYVGRGSLQDTSESQMTKLQQGQRAFSAENRQNYPSGKKRQSLTRATCHRPPAQRSTGCCGSPPPRASRKASDLVDY